MRRKVRAQFGAERHPNPTCTAALACCLIVVAAPPPARATDPWADHIVEDLTFGPFHSSALWNDPNAVLGKPNTLDRDDTNWSNPTFREIHMCWPAWYKGTNDATLANTPYTGGNPTTNNGTGLRGGGQIVVEFDEPIVNNADDAGAYHWGIDFIVHGNPFFVGVEGTNYPDTNMEEYHIKQAGSSTPMATGNIFSEPVTVSVAQYADGPWYTFVQETDGEGNPIWPIVSADNYFPTQPFAWDSVAHDWTSQELDWTKPVNPNLTGADFGGLTVAGYYDEFGEYVPGAIDLYEGSAGGTGFDLDWLTDEYGNPVSLDWIQYVKISDPYNLQGEITGFVDVVPEPITVAMLGLGGMSLVVRRGRRA
ncbi:MAG: PEP-CTERM sorting domain-containing protein [Phycisphaerae bacterium]|nr:PEP-CTERM sorting domain-containing protein [Phycisphaerae bacterium]